MEQLDITAAFEEHIRVPAVQNMGEMAAVLAESGLFESEAAVMEVLKHVREYTAGSDRIGVGIKTILTTADGEPAEVFAERIAGHIASSNPRGMMVDGNN